MQLYIFISKGNFTSAKYSTLLLFNKGGSENEKEHVYYSKCSQLLKNKMIFICCDIVKHKMHYFKINIKHFSKAKLIIFYIFLLR